MATVYYFDTGIWLDLWELRDEPNFPKGTWAQKLLNKIIGENGKIIYSEVTLLELGVVGYSTYDIAELFRPLQRILEFVESSEKQMNRANDLAATRQVPKRDILHALIAKEQRAALITYDRHFQILRDIIEPKRPRDFIS